MHKTFFSLKNEIEVVTKLRNSNCDISKTQIGTKLKNWKYDKSKTQIVNKPNKPKF